jgi:hypothetical protein
MNFRIIPATKRPKRDVLVRRFFSLEGEHCVNVEAWGSDTHQTEEVVSFETEQAARFYVETFSEAAAVQFMKRALENAKRDQATTERDLANLQQ